MSGLNSSHERYWPISHAAVDFSRAFPKFLGATKTPHSFFNFRPTSHRKASVSDSISGPFHKPLIHSSAPPRPIPLSYPHKNKTLRS